MVGWSRRGSESAKRRKIWWDSLTPEQQEIERQSQLASDIVAMPILYTVTTVSILILIAIVVARLAGII